MFPDFLEEPDRVGLRLAGTFARTFLWYVLAAAVVWLVGIESSYGNPMPFYALLHPAFDSLLVPVTAGVVMALVYVVGSRFVGQRATSPQRAALGLWLIAVALLVYGFFYEAHAKNVTPLAFFLAQWRAIRWHMLALLVFLLALGGLWYGARRSNWIEEAPSRRAVVWFLAGLIFFVFAFSAAVAMTRNGPESIAQAYQRHGYEYASDIGATGTIRALFGDYLKVRPYLSMHAKVHPPGPIALLWVLSFGVGQGALALSLATMLVGALAIVPLYFWAADLTDRRVALTCCVLYSLVPSIVLFTATSADILFMPFSLAALFLFWRALHRRSIAYALAAGAVYAFLSLLSFSLLSLGAFFAFVGLWRFSNAEYRRAVVQTAVVMIGAFLAVHVAVRAWSGFDMIACYRACKAQFDLDQTNLDLLAPRFPAWSWKVLNPACWFFFAGIPVSVLFAWRLIRPERASRSLFIVAGFTLIALDLLYLGRGEGERSAMYIVPFLVLPAAHLVDQMVRATRSYTPLAATILFMAFQCWLIESFLYTYW